MEKIGRTLASGDIDNDGDLDLLVTNNGGAVNLLRNNAGGDNVGLLLRLVGTRSNRNAIGARLRVTAGGRTQVREVKAGSTTLVNKTCGSTSDLARPLDRSTRDSVAVGHH